MKDPTCLRACRLFPRDPDGGVLSRRAWLAGVAAVLSPAVRAARPGEVAVGQVLPDALMRGLNGPDRRLSHFRGKPLVINVWASWCGPCRAEMASLERLAWGDLAGELRVIGISTDDYPEAAKGFLARANATLDHYLDRKLELENMLGAAQLPLTVLVDAHGKVLDKVVGARPWDSPEAQAYVVTTLGLQRKRGKPARPAG